jgi:DNA-3-methyladenine glycosylase
MTQERAELRAWLARPAPEVAPDLLGALLTSTVDGQTVTVRLTEVEAYDGSNDPGSHAFRGRTARNEVMFGAAGHLYVYRHMGLHHCANVVTGPDGAASAVLVRAGEVVAGIDGARRRRLRSGVARRDVDLARGPARLAVCLGLDLAVYGLDLLDARSLVRLEPAPEAPGPGAVLVGPRVGVAGPGGDGGQFPWRFWLADDPTVSTFRAGAAPRRRTATTPATRETAD